MKAMVQDPRKHSLGACTKPGHESTCRLGLQGQVYRAPSQASPGNEFNAGSPGFQKAPTRGPASLVARCFLRAEHQLSDAQARSMRTPTMTRIVARTGRRTLSGTRALRWLPRKMPGREPMTSEPSRPGPASLQCRPANSRFEGTGIRTRGPRSRKDEAPGGDGNSQRGDKRRSRNGS